MVSVTSFNISFGQRARLNLPNIALLCLVLSQYGGSAHADGLLQQVINEMASALGIEPGGSSISIPSVVTTTPQVTSSQPSTSTTDVLPSPATTGTLPTNGTAANSTVSLPARAVFAHFIVGNTYNYTVSSWSNDIALAASKGIDAFALNIGASSWEPSQIANAFRAAASKYNANASNAAAPFRLFLSLDMSSFPCSTASSATPLQSLIKTYANNSNTFRYNNRMFLSTFAGESCLFGASSLNQGWINAIKPTNGSLPGVWFVPSFFVDPQTFKNLTVIDGAFHWNSAWPMGNYNISFAPDQSYISNLQNKTYMAAASPWFFTHYGLDTFNKNWIYRGDDWLFDQRWEMLIQNRNNVSLTEVATWNDYGESHYMGPIEGIQPMSQAWVNGFDHQGWLDLLKYYIPAYKNGTYPTITKDRVFLWARLYPVNATAPDAVGRPANWPWTQDYLWAVTLLTSAANVALSCGSSTSKTLVPAGLSKLKLPLSTNCAVKASVIRGSTTSVNYSPPDFNFNTKPPSYNFNAFVAASPP